MRFSSIEVRQKKIASLAFGKILDVGYADHPNLFLKGEIIGIDLVEPRKSPENYKKLILGNADEIGESFKPKGFNTIVAAEIIEHLENPSKFLRGARKILKDDGRLIISTPNPYHLPTLVANVFFLRPEFTAHK